MNRIIELKKNAEMFYTEIALSDVADVYTGKQLNKSDMSNDGLYAVMNGGIEPSGYTNNYNEEENTITISQGGASAGYVNWNSEKIWIGAHCYAIHPIKNKINNRYLYFVLKEKQEVLMQSKQGAGIPGLNRSIIQKLYIPLPHTNVQKRIVEILDSFTNLIDALNEELSLRQKQFEYYREKLLTFDDNTNMQKICNFATIQSGKNKERTDNGQFPLFGSTGLISRTNISVYEGDYILIARVGANAGFTYRVNGKFDVSDNTLIVTIIKNNTINIDYLYHCLIEQNLNKYAKGGGQPLVTSGELKNISIPIPPLAIQQSIVEKLDAFEFLISSLKEEIALRQKQYEYYREKLLTFN